MVICGREVAVGVVSGDKKEWVHDPLLSFVRSCSEDGLKPFEASMQAEFTETQASWGCMVA